MMLRAVAAERNAEPISDVLRRYLLDDMKIYFIAASETKGPQPICHHDSDAHLTAVALNPDLAEMLLEIASGTGQHIIKLAEKFPGVTFQPSEIDARSLHSIVAYIDHYRLGNVRVPLFIDVTKPVSHWALPEDYGPRAVDVVLNSNMIHISCDAAVEGLFKAAAVLLKRGSGLLITYGPYAIDGVISPQSNIDFDASLRKRNPEWGLRDTAYLSRLASSCGLTLVARHDMPANNHLLIFSRESRESSP